MYNSVPRQQCGDTTSDDPGDEHRQRAHAALSSVGGADGGIPRLISHWSKLERGLAAGTCDARRIAAQDVAHASRLDLVDPIGGHRRQASRICGDRRCGVLVVEPVSTAEPRELVDNDRRKERADTGAGGMLLCQPAHE